MAKVDATARPPRLCYLHADQLRGPFPTLQHFEVKDRNDENVGRLDGIVIDAVARRMEYFVVQQGFLHRRRYLLPLSPASLDSKSHVLRVDVNKRELAACERFDVGTYLPYSDEDTLAAMFHGYHDEEHEEGDEDASA